MKSYKIGEIAGSKPAAAPSPPRQGAKNPLTVTDIAGTTTGTRGLGVFEHAKRKNAPLSTNLVIKDIFGANPGSFVRGMITTRSKHPLDQNYQYPGNSELDYKSPFSLTKKEKETLARKTLANSGTKVVEGHSQTSAQKFDSFIKN